MAIVTPLVSKVASLVKTGISQAGAGGGTTPPTPSGAYLLAESGDNLITEDSNKLITE